jgi:hypothetical protein
MAPLILRPKWETELGQHRSAGQRAGLTREKIAYLAFKYFGSVGPKDFTIRKFAAKFHIAPTTIRTHFKGGPNELRMAIAWHTLSFLGHSVENPQQFLNEVFSDALKRLAIEPALWPLVAVELTNNPFVSSLFAERVCSSIVSIAPKCPPIDGLEIVCSRLAGMVLLESGAWARNDASGMNGLTFAKAKGEKAAIIAGWVEGMTPNAPSDLKSLSKLSANLGKRASPDYLAKQSERAVALTIGELRAQKKLGSQKAVKAPQN